MTVFLTLVGKLFPLYILITLGWIAGRFLPVRKESVSALLIYIIMPVVTFHAAAIMELSASLLLLPVLFFILGVLLCMLFYVIGGAVWKDATRNLLAFGAGMGNTGYFGLPLLIAVLGNQAFVIGVFIDLGMNIYQCTFGCFVAAKGNLTARDSLRTVLRLPTAYALAAGLLWNALHLGFPSVLTDFAAGMRGAYTTLGMMLIGVALSELRRFSLDLPYLLLSFFAKFIVWPAVILGLVWVDGPLHIFSPFMHQTMIILSLAPLAANTVTYAAHLKIYPEKAATAVLLSTLFALIYIPAALLIL